MEYGVFSKELKNKAKEINIILSEDNVQKFYNYMDLLLEWNEKINLTAITDPNEVILKHFVDSLTINKYIEKDSKLIDIGTGAGFPGVPISIINENINIILLDSLNKRINFLNEVIKDLELKKIETVHARVEEAGKEKKYRETFDIATSRAVAPLNILLEYMLPLVKKDGICICMKGPNTEEINQASKSLEILGGKIEKIEKIILPKSDIERNIIIVRKIKNTPSKYPRKPGTPSKEPLI